ncbi:MAG: nucleoside phosphorylase [Deltaproteobacteria bacterium]
MKKTSSAPKMIVEPLHFVGYALGDRISRLKDHHTVLFCFDVGIYGKLKKMFRGSIFSGLTGELYLMDNKTALAGKFGIGSPAAITFLEELAACGIKRFVGIGSAGALHNDINHGDVVLCTGAFSDEGVSEHYPGYSKFSKPARTLISRLASYFKKQKIKFAKGKAWSIDAPYRETKEKLRHFLNKGADVVEMEASAMFNVARFRKVEIANVFIVSDSISDGIWNPMFRAKDIKSKSLSVAGEIILFLSENPP